MAALALVAQQSGDASASYTFSNGSTGADTITNAQLVAGINQGRLANFLTASYLTQAALDLAWAAAGGIHSEQGAGVFRLITAAPGSPTITTTTTGATGTIRIALSYSASV